MEVKKSFIAPEKLTARITHTSEKLPHDHGGVTAEFPHISSLSSCAEQTLL
jgi:hypothetical protein